MKKSLSLLLGEALTFLICSGCTQPDGICPQSIMVDGVIYYCYDEVIDIPEDIVILGYIDDASVSIKNLPQKNNQTNHEPYLHQPYACYDNQMVLYYDGEWRICISSEDTK